MNTKRQKLQLLLLSCFFSMVFGCAVSSNTQAGKQSVPPRSSTAKTSAAVYVMQDPNAGITAGASAKTAVDKSTGNSTTISTKTLRVDRADVNGLKSAFDRIRRAPGTVVVFLGDSQTYGSFVSANYTIPAYLQQTLKARYPGHVITVINLGIKGLKPADAYFIVRQLASMNVDMLIYNISRGWFYPQNTLTYPVLIKLTGAEKEAARWHLRIPAPSRGSNPASTGKNGQQKKPVILNWRENPDLLPKGPKTKLAPLTLDDSNLQWELYLATIKAWQKTDRPALFYLSPANWELLKLKYVIDFSMVHKEYREIVNAAVSRGIPCQDYNSLISDRLFVDEIHLQKKGHLQLAKKLADDIAGLPAARAVLDR